MSEIQTFPSEETAKTFVGPDLLGHNAHIHAIYRPDDLYANVDGLVWVITFKSEAGKYHILLQNGTCA